MKAAVLVRKGAASQAFEFREFPDPLPKEGEVLIDVELSGLNFADVMARLGLYPEAPPLPSILGYEVVGTVEALGPGAPSSLKRGERVIGFTRFGGYATRVIAKANGVVPVPESIDSASATALATQYGTAYFAAEEMVKLQKNDRVLIHAAAGGVGTALVQLARRRGCVIFGTAGSAEKIAYLKSQGVDFPINYRESDFETEYLKLSGGKKVDVIFDAVGGETFKKGMRILSAGGRMVTYGVSEMTGSHKASLLKSVKTVLSFGLHPPLSLLTRSQSILGVNMLKIADHRPDLLERAIRGVTELARLGEVKPVVGKVFEASSIADAHEFLGSRASIGKVAIRWR
jgi:NADPH2:quinone reductase